MLGSSWSHAGIMIGSRWDHFMAMLGSCKDRTGIILKSFSNHFQFSLGSFWDDVGITSRSSPQNGMIMLYSMGETGEELDMFLVVFGLAPWKMRSPGRVYGSLDCELVTPTLLGTALRSLQGLGKQRFFRIGALGLNGACYDYS